MSVKNVMYVKKIIFGITHVRKVIFDVMYVKKVIFGILLHVVVKMENICQVLWIIQQLCVMKL